MAYNPIDGSIIGCALSVTTPLTVNMGSGVFYLPGSIRAATDTTISVTLGSATVSTWYHVYGYVSGSTPSIEVNTTAPAAPYTQTARCKTGDTSRRWLGAIYCYAANNFYPVLHDIAGATGNVLDLLAPGGVYSVSKILNIGTSSSAVNVSAATIIPPQGKKVRFVASNTSALTAYLSNSSLGTVSTTNYLRILLPNTGDQMDLPVDSSQQISYIFSGIISLGGGLTLQGIGYCYDR